MDSNNAIKLLKNYLSDRNQYVQLGLSWDLTWNTGSVMGPLPLNELQKNLI